MAKVYSDIKGNAAHNASAKAFIQSRFVLRFRGTPLGDNCERLMIRIAEMIEAGDAAGVSAMLDTEARLNRAGLTAITGAAK